MFCGSRRKLRAFVVDLFDVALGAGRSDDVRAVGDPALEPVEALAAHAGRKHGDAVAVEQPGDRHTAAAVVARGWPDRAVTRRVEAAGDDARHQTTIGREHLVRADHRKAIAERDDDLRLHARERLRQHEISGHRYAPRARLIVEPVHTPQIRRQRLVGTHAFEHHLLALRDRLRIRELGECRQRYAQLAQALHGAFAHVGIDDFRLKSDFAHCAAGWRAALSKVLPYQKQQRPTA